MISVNFSIYIDWDVFLFFLRKSTFFNVLTKSAATAENFPFCTIDPNESKQSFVFIMFKILILIIFYHYAHALNHILTHYLNWLFTFLLHWNRMQLWKLKICSHVVFFGWYRYLSLDIYWTKMPYHIKS